MQKREVIMDPSLGRRMFAFACRAEEKERQPPRGGKAGLLFAGDASDKRPG